MLRILIRQALPLLALFTLSVLLVRAQPYDDADLRGFLLPPPGCPAPCWQGIRPGTTHAEDALAILRLHPWVTQVTGQWDVARWQLWIFWEWSGQQPAFINTRQLAFILAERDGIISHIDIPTRVPLGAALLTFDELGRQGVAVPLGTRRGGPSGSQHLYYVVGEFAAFTAVQCPLFGGDVERMVFGSSYYTDFLDRQTGFDLAEIRRFACQ